jgi:flagellar protein FliO/FliZ
MRIVAQLTIYVALGKFMEITEVLRFLAALIFVIGLIAACAWAARRFGLVQMGETASTRGRLAVVESLAIDPKRKLLIIRHDDREHLVMLGDQDMVLDAGLPAKEAEEMKTPTPQDTQPNQLAGSVADQMQKVVSLLKERRA